ncbi:siderophore-interacting protein [Actinomycetes bacterium KLBMP 9759]
MSYSEVYVVSTELVTPHMRRITLGGAGLADFSPIAPDQQVKLFFSRDGGRPEVPLPPPDGDKMRWYQSFMAVPEERRPWMRTYSVRRHLADRQQLEIDFVMHGENGGDGPASSWAATARAGAMIGLLGPAISHYRTAEPGAAKLFVGDETALPAMAAWVESLPAGERAVVFAEVLDAKEEQLWEPLADVTVNWVHRGGRPHGPDLLVEAVRSAELPPAPLFAWLAGEASTVRALRRHLVDERGLEKRAIAFSGYWRADMTQDEPPTAAELEDHADVLP